MFATNTQNRINTASSAAGLGLIVGALPALLGNWQDPYGWGQVFAGLIAIFKRG